MIKKLLATLCFAVLSSSVMAARIDITAAPYSAVGNGIADDSTAIQSAINAAVASGLTANGRPKDEVYAPAGKIFKIGTGLLISDPIKLNFESDLLYSGSAGYAVTIGTSYKWMQYGDYKFSGIYKQSGIGGFPSTVNNSGPSGLRVNHMQFSNVEVGTIQGFSKHAVYLDGTGIGYTKVVQHNTFDFQQIVNNGIGIFAESLHPATSSVEANRFYIQNIYQNYINIQLDSPSYNFNATSSNSFFINAMDNNTAIGLGGHGCLIYGSFNHFEIGYMETDIYEVTPSQSNTYRVFNTTGTGAAWYARPGGNSTYWAAP